MTTKDYDKLLFLTSSDINNTFIVGFILRGELIVNYLKRECDLCGRDK